MYNISHYSDFQHIKYNKCTLQLFSFMTAIHILYINFSYQNFPHTHTHLHYTLQFVINISLISNTVSRGQLTAVHCVTQWTVYRTVSNSPYRRSYCVIMNSKPLLTAIRIALLSSVLKKQFLSQSIYHLHNRL